MYQEFSETISRARQDRGMTQEAFATRLGVTPQAVSRWERGNGLPDVTMLQGICEVLHINANELLGLAGWEMVENHDSSMVQEIRENLIAEPLCIEFGSGWIPCFSEGLQTDYVNLCRKNLARRTGMLMPVIKIRDNISLPEFGMRIKVYDEIVFEREYDEIAENAYEKIIDQATAVCEAHYARILNKQLVKVLVENVKEQYPGAADDLIPEKISYYQVLKRLRSVVAQQGQIRDLLHILEEMEEELTHAG